MREINAHKVAFDPALGASEVNQSIRITADDPGPGGASHRYTVSEFNTGSNPAAVDDFGFKWVFNRLAVIFQHGPAKENGVNGITDEALMAILIDRLEGFEAGKYNCPENKRTLFHLKAALESSQSRTKKRQVRGVEGTMAV